MLNKPKNLKYVVYHNLNKPNTFKLKTNFIKTKCGLLVKENSIITAGQLAAAVLSIKRKIKQDISFTIRTFPHLPVTKRPPEQPLGKGKSNVSY